MFALMLVAVCLGLSNLGAAVGIGAGGIDSRTRLRVAVIFGLFEAGMPILGLLLGRGLTVSLGQAAHWIGAALLVAMGGYTVIQALRGPASDGGQPPAMPGGQRTGRLLVAGAALSMDNLAVGFALGTFRVSLAVAAIMIGAISVCMSLIGLELGNKIGTLAGGRGELVGGLALIAVGVAVAIGSALCQPAGRTGVSCASGGSRSRYLRDHPEYAMTSDLHAKLADAARTALEIVRRERTGDVRGISTSSVHTATAIRDWSSAPWPASSTTRSPPSMNSPFRTATRPAATTCSRR